MSPGRKWLRAGAQAARLVGRGRPLEAHTPGELGAAGGIGMSPKVSISRAHRDALYRELLVRLSEVDDLQRFGDTTDPERIEGCARIGRRATDILRLIHDGGLGWGFPAGREAVEISLPAEELRRIATERRSELARNAEAKNAEREELKAEWRDEDQAQEACTSILRQLGEGLAHG